VKRRIPKQTSDFRGECGTEVMVSFAEDDRHRRVDSAQRLLGDDGVLPVERGRKFSGPLADGGERVGLAVVTVELREDGLRGQTVGIRAVEFPLPTPPLQQPQALRRVADHVVG